MSTFESTNVKQGGRVESFRANVVAGLTTAAVVVPKCMACAAIAGLPAQAGLYAALAPMLAYALLGTSRVLSVSTTSTIAILTSGALAEGRMHFANAQRIGDKMWPLIRAARPHAVILDCSAVPDIEYTALRMLTQAEVQLRRSGVTLYLVTLNPQARQALSRSELGRTLSRHRMFVSIDAALTHASCDSLRPAIFG